MKEEQNSDLINELNSGTEKLMKNFEKFKLLQDEIEHLHKIADHDIDARMKLEKIEAAFPNGLKNEKIQIENYVNSIKSQFKQLETQINNIKI